MKKLCAVMAAWAMAGLSAWSAPVVIEDFESYEIGHTFTLWNYWGSEMQSTAVVEADPADASNKVLRVTLKNWNDYIELSLPEGITPAMVGSKYTLVNFDLRRHADDPCGEWKHFDIILGSEKLYRDVDSSGNDTWPSYGAATNAWAHYSYGLAVPAEDNKSTTLRLGFNSDTSDYYIDNIEIAAPYEIFDDGKLDFSNPSSTASSYSEYSSAIMIPEGTELGVYTSRYTHWTSKIVGTGRLNIYAGGERVYLSNAKSEMMPDWSAYTGDVHVYAWPEVNTGVKAGFYGILLGHGGKKFNSDDIKGSIIDGNITPQLENNRVTLHAGATLGTEGNSTARAFRIGELTTEQGSNLLGHIKDAAYRVYFVVGALGTDATLAGNVVPAGSKSIVGLVKEGRGTYTITGTENNLSGGLSIVGGRVNLDGSVKGSGVTVYTGGELGGTGRIECVTDVYGHLCPGGEAAGQLTLADLRMRPSGRIVCRVESAESHDCIEASGNVGLYNITEGLVTSDVTPVLEISVPESHQLKAGDKITLIHAAGKTALDGESNWKFRVQYPPCCTWDVVETVADGGYSLTATVTSLDYSGQGDETRADGEGTVSGGDDEYAVDYTPDYNDATPLRSLAKRAGKSIGVAVPAWKYAVDDDTDGKISLITSQFNIVVAENEMKIDATEPDEGRFEFYNADRLVAMASRNEQEVRGHTLVWHQQVPAWITSDGKKNSNNFSRDRLLSIMYNHIDGVMGHLKGKVREWDVVNECLDDDQSVVRGDPTAFKLRPSVWQLGIGEDFIAEAFRRAHQADPDAKLFLNDYGVEFVGQAKAEALYNLARKLVEQGVPIHGVGLQCHLTVGNTDASRLAANIRRYQDLGLECIVTELDVAQADPSAADAHERQAKAYGSLVKAALSQSNCPTVMIWGLLDGDSWRQNYPLIFNDDLSAKRAYYAVHAALREIAASTDVESIAVTSATPLMVEYFNLQGLRIASPEKNSGMGVVIRRTTLSDGTVVVDKIVL